MLATDRSRQSNEFDTAMGRLFHAGSGFMIRPAGLQIELWKLDGSIFEFVHRAPAEVGSGARVDLNSSLAAVSAVDGSVMWTVAIPAGRIQRFEPDSVAVNPLSMITGADREQSHLLWLSAPPEIIRPMQLIAIDSEENVERLGAFQRQGEVPIHVPEFRGQIGIAYAEGSLAWY